MQKSFTVPKLGRLQIALASGYDPDVVAAAMELTPIKVEIIRFSSEGFQLMMTFPKGIKASILENTEDHQPYYADTKNDVYSLLFVSRREGQGVTLIGEGSTLANDLLLTRKYPLIIEPVINDLRNANKFQLLVGCYKTIEIFRSEAVTKLTAYDPFDIPNQMIDTLSILDEEIPSTIANAKIFSKRIENVRDLFKWYGKKLLSDETKERLQIIATRLQDKQIRVDGFLESRDESLTEGMSLKTKPKSFNEQFADNDGYEEVAAALAETQWPDIPIHNCADCNGRARTVNRNVMGEDGTKEIWFVECVACKKRSERHDWGVKSQTIASWNKINGEYQSDTFPDCLEFNNLSDDAVFRKIKSINTLIMKMEESIRVLTPSAKESLANDYVRLLDLKIWTSYIRTALKQKRKVTSS